MANAVIVTCEFSNDEAQLLENALGHMRLWHLKSRIESARQDAVEDLAASERPGPVVTPQPGRYLWSQQ